MINVFKRITNAIIKFFKRMFNVFSRKTRDLPGTEIRILGARRSGKTTFLAALAHWPNAPQSNSPIELVTPASDDTAKLVDMAKDLLENGLSFAGNYLVEDINNLSYYNLLIEMKPAFRLAGNIRLEIGCRDYPGELMEQLRGGNTSTGVLSDYLDDCAQASGLLLLIDGTAREDKKYSQALDKLKQELNTRLMERGDNSLNSYRIAVVFSKAEQKQVWIHRHDISKFVKLKFPLSQNTLEKWSKEWKCSINYFFCSAFGMKGKPPQPNVKVEIRDAGATCGVIDRTQSWKPFGLVAPIYWLYTGKDDQRLRKMED